jgi:purine-binding chemotaxis protein CheW
MFASEKVMLDYLGQLLNEDENANEVVGVPSDVNEFKKDLANVNTDYLEKEPVLIKSEPKPQLRPIISATAKLQEYKEEPDVLLAEPNSVEKLLQQVNEEQVLQKKIKEDSKTVDLVGTEVKVQTKVEALVEEKAETQVKDTFPDKPFQALFFEVAGLVLAVPLQELGGIHNLTEVNSLFGKPKWFKGVMLNREKKLNVVDSALWVMPEKYDAIMEAEIEYKYLITLGGSDWGLTAEKLVETETVHPDDVKWRNGQGKRPWLLGTIKEKMCALLHVSDLIAMLEQGIDARHE